MISKVEMFTTICDNCQVDIGNDSEYSCWNEDSFAEENATESGWLKEGSKHYCVDCYSYDDDDNLIINKSRTKKTFHSMKKVVINKCFGGFGLSLFGQLEYAKLKDFDLFFYRQTKYEHSGGVNEYERIDDINQDQFFSFSIKKDLGKVISEFPQYDDIWFSCRDIDREDLHLIEVVEKFPNKVHGRFAKLKVVEIPSDIEYEINEYGGKEHIAEVHRTWL